jgi:hypothetical protein
MEEKSSSDERGECSTSRMSGGGGGESLGRP